MVDAAAELNMSRRWPQGSIKTVLYCYLLAGHRKLFDESGMEAFRSAMRGAAEARHPHYLMSEPRKFGRFRSVAAPGRVLDALSEALRLARAKRPRP